MKPAPGPPWSATRSSGRRRAAREYYEALRHSGRPRRRIFLGVEDQSIRDHLGEHGVGAEQNRSPLWSRAAYDRYLEWTLSRDDPERRLRRQAHVGLLRRLRQPRPQHPRLPGRAAGRPPPHRLPQPHLRPRRPRQQGAPGGLAVEGGADGEPGARTRRPRARSRSRTGVPPTAPSSRSTARSCALSTTGRSTTSSSS